MAPPEKRYDDEGLTPELKQAVEELIALHERSPVREIVIDTPPAADITPSSQGSPFFPDDMAPVFDEAAYKRGVQEIERRGIDVLLMSPKALDERSRKKGDELADTFRDGSCGAVKPLAVLKMQRKPQ